MATTQDYVMIGRTDIDDGYLAMSTVTAFRKVAGATMTAWVCYETEAEAGEAAEDLARQLAEARDDAHHNRIIADWYDNA